MESGRTVGGRRWPTVVIGPLADYAAGFRQFLIAQGYARRTITFQVSLMAHLSRWLQAEGLTVDALRSSADIDRFFVERRARGHSSAVSANALVALLGFLRDRLVIGASAADAETPAGRLLAAYGR